MEKEKNFVSAVVYIHNAENQIGEFIHNVSDVLSENFHKFEIICVNDASTDNSVAAAKKSAEQYVDAPLTIIEMSEFHGVELSMNAGVDLAIGDYVFEFDSPVMDFEKKLIMDVYWKSLKGYDIVSAAPDKQSNAGSGCFYRLFNRYSHSNYKMQTERFRIVSRRLINRVGAVNQTIAYRKVVYANSGLAAEYISYSPNSTELIPKDKQDKTYRWNLALKSFILFTDVGYRFSIWMTEAMMLITLLVAVYAVVIFCTGSPVAGWTTTILFLSIAFFGLFGILSVVIKYLDILVNLSSVKQQYRIKNIEKVNK